MQPLRRAFGLIAPRDPNVTDEEMEKRIAAYYASRGIYCLNCQGTGTIGEDFEYQEPWMAKPMKAKRSVVCPDCKGVTATRETALRLRYRMAGLSDVVATALTFQTWKPEMNPAMASALRDAQDYAAHPHGGLVFVGDTGLGKTHLAVAALQVCMINGLSGAYAESRVLLSQLQEGIRNDNYQAVLDWWRDKASVILIDDVGAQRNTDWANDVIEDILTYRHAHDRAFILTTNTTGDQIPERIRSRFSDRQRVRVVACKGVDVRPKL